MSNWRPLHRHKRLCSRRSTHRVSPFTLCRCLSFPLHQRNCGPRGSSHESELKSEVFEIRANQTANVRVFLFDEVVTNIPSVCQPACKAPHLDTSLFCPLNRSSTDLIHRRSRLSLYRRCNPRRCNECRPRRSSTGVNTDCRDIRFDELVLAVRQMHSIHSRVSFATRESPNLSRVLSATRESKYLIMSWRSWQKSWCVLIGSGSSPVASPVGRATLRYHVENHVCVLCALFCRTRVVVDPPTAFYAS